MKEIIIIYGATASGKTKLSLELANTLKAAIINMDSKQFYYYLELLTASPTKEEKQIAPHYFFNNYNPMHNITVDEWYKKVQEFIDSTNFKCYIIVGGSGFYAKYFLTAGQDSVQNINYDDLINIYINFFKWEDIYSIFFKENNLITRKIPHLNDKFRQFNYLKAYFAQFISSNKINYDISSFQIYPDKLNILQHNEHYCLQKDKYYNLSLFILNPNEEELFNNIKIRTPTLITDKTIQEAQFVYKNIPYGKNFKTIIGFSQLNQPWSKEEILADIIQKTISYSKQQKKWINNLSKYNGIMLEGYTNNLYQKILQKILHNMV